MEVRLGEARSEGGVAGVRFRTLSLASSRAVRVLGAAVAGWCALWATLGVLVGHDLWILARVGETTVGAAGAHNGAISPLLGAVLGHGGDSLAEGGHLWAHAMRSLGVVLPIALVALTTLPAIALYVEFRRRWGIERAALMRRLGPSRDPAFERYLAHVALASVPYERLLEWSVDPWGDLEAGRFGALADAELARLGIARPAERARIEAAVSA